MVPREDSLHFFTRAFFFNNSNWSQRTDFKWGLNLSLSHLLGCIGTPTDKLIHFTIPSWIQSWRNSHSSASVFSVKLNGNQTTEKFRPWKKPPNDVQLNYAFSVRLTCIHPIMISTVPTFTFHVIRCAAV